MSHSNYLGCPDLDFAENVPRENIIELLLSFVYSEHYIKTNKLEYKADAKVIEYLYAQVSEEDAKVVRSLDFSQFPKDWFIRFTDSCLVMRERPQENGENITNTELYLVLTHALHQVLYYESDRSGHVTAADWFGEFIRDKWLDTLWCLSEVDRRYLKWRFDESYVITKELAPCLLS